MVAGWPYRSGPRGTLCGDERRRNYPGEGLRAEGTGWVGLRVSLRSLTTQLILCAAPHRKGVVQGWPLERSVEAVLFLSLRCW